ncbi:epoxide hydrolase 4-like [Asterias amurensis]|uniref:epoxide hydrolase 4-like n=1 Tax=Asterias amurensis TaxID=7602 RepID=UPI003AB52E1E
MARGLFAVIVQALFTLTYALFGALMVSFGILVKTIKKGPKAVFAWHDREKMPECMQNPELGTHGFLRLKDVRLHYVAIGDEDKPLMLMVHGFPECWYSWRFQMIEFKKDYRVVAIDQRGYGTSDTPIGVANYSVKKLAADINDVVASLGYSSCILVAHDWGGAVAWQVADSYPDTVDKLITMNIPHPRCMMDHMLAGYWQQILASWYIFFFQLPFLPELNCKIEDYGIITGAFLSGEMGLKNRENMTADDIEAFKYSASHKGNLTGMINYYRAALRYPSKIRSTITTPTLIVWGDQDGALKVKLLEGTDKYVSDLKVMIVPGASHWVQQDSPAVVNGHMRDFLGVN